MIRIYDSLAPIFAHFLSILYFVFNVECKILVLLARRASNIECNIQTISAALQFDSHFTIHNPRM